MWKAANGRLIGNTAFEYFRQRETGSEVARRNASRPLVFRVGHADHGLYRFVEPRLIPHAEELRIARDPKRQIDERLEAYQSIVDTDLGDTFFSRSRQLEREIGLRQVYLKFEGGNPTGTHKDRIAFAQVTDALRRGYSGITVATCGNYGAAVARAAWLAGISCTVFFPGTYHPRRVDHMLACGAEIRWAPAECDYENTVVLSQGFAKEQGVYDANPGGDNTAIQLEAYGQIAYEIYRELGDAPAAVAVPVSNGTTLAGIYRGFVSLFRRGKTSHIPRMVAGSSFHKNPIIRSFSKDELWCVDLKPESLRETSINEPLINWHSLDGDLALQAIRESQGWARDISDRAMLHCARSLREWDSITALPAATAGLMALATQHLAAPLSGGRYVAVITGKRP